MTEKIDQRDKLHQNPFEYKITKNNKVFIYWNSQCIKVLSKDKATRFKAKIKDLSDWDIQLLLAKITGHFKHGNEKMNK